MKFTELREKHQYCSFDSIDIIDQESSYLVKYQFSIDNLDTFVTEWTFEKCDVPYFSSTSEVYKRMIFDLGMVELISYYKMTCAKEIRIACGHLTAKQAEFYRKLIYNGLGEFLYRNNIDVTREELCYFSNLNDETEVVVNDVEHHGILLPVGGGKDSITSLEILRKSKMLIKPFMINGRGATVETCRVGGFSRDAYIDVKRKLDSKIIEYNKKGYLNGHIPFSSVVAFAAQIVAEANHLEYIALSNEDSANESTVIGLEVNHQYSKSLEFENDFREYNKHIYSSCPDYFSLLRPFSEYQIGKYFATCSAYHPIFRSCNLGSKEDKWCNNCAKCLYVYVLLSAFLSKDEMIAIFHDDLLIREDLLEVFFELIGERKEKPFECVGSIDEINMAIIDGIKYYETNGLEIPLMYKEYMKLDLYESTLNKENMYHKFYNTNNNIPSVFVELVREEMKVND